MLKETENLINLWLNTYTEYLKHLKVPDEDIIDVWVDKSNSLMEYYQKIVDGEINIQIKSFSDYLLSQVNYYQRLNEYYHRFGDLVKPTVVNNGGRYWK